MSSKSNLFSAARSFLRSSSMYSRDVLEVYGSSMVKKKDKLIELAKDKLEQASKFEIARKFRVAKGYYTLEMAPPKVKDAKRMKDDIVLVKEFITGNCWKHLTVRQAWLLFLVGLEILLWFYLGETIGKLHLVGYKIK